MTKNDTDVREYAGYRRHAVSEITGTTVVLLDGKVGGYDTEGGRWQTICDEHSMILSHTSLKDARVWLLAPQEWCEDCMDAIEQREEEKVAERYAVALVNISDGSVAGHKAGCADLTRSKLRRHAAEVWTLEVEDKAQAWIEYNVDFLAEGGEDNAYDIDWSPCAKSIPAGDTHARYVATFDPA